MTMKMSFTPLRDVSSVVVNKGYKNNFGYGSYTQPSSSIQDRYKKRRLADIHSLGQNLMSKFSDINHNRDNEVFLQIKDSQISSFANSHTVVTQRLEHPLNCEQDVIEGNHYVSLNETEITSIQYDDLQGYNDIGDPVFKCQFCGANMWYQERIKKHKSTSNPKFQLCCGLGKIQLPLLKNPPHVLQHLLFDHDSSDSKNYQAHIRAYNMMFAFTSPGAKLDKTYNNGRGPPSVRIQGQSCHLIGSLLPMPGHTPKFAQLYIYDTENEIQNRLRGLRYQENLDPQIIIKLTAMLDEFNVFAKSFRMAKQRFQDSSLHDLKLKLISERTTDGRIYNLPTVSEVAALIVGDFDSASNRDIILETQSGKLQRINELHAGYLGLQYPLLFPYGEDGYRHDVQHRNTNVSQVYMDHLYFDAMAICSFVGFPDSFLTFTYLYTIEFQKRGLPHAHILLFLHSSSKYPTPEDIDKIISAEIPNQDQNKDLYELVKTHMIHGPCGLANTSSPCMKNGKCSRYYPKKFQISTIVDQDGFPVYRRRNNGNEVEKNGIILDNCYIVPYNPQLLLKYQAHINIEWCNQSTSIKYLFKYIHKGYDHITATIVPSQTEDESFVQVIDEIKDYLDCRYISPCEACWRIFSFPIHNRTPAVERLYFHLPNEQSIYFNDYEDIDSLLSRPTIKDSMFTSWMDANKKYSKGKNLTYAQFVSKFVYVAKERRWKPRKQGYTIGRLNWIPPSTGELFYLRMMLSVSKDHAAMKTSELLIRTEATNLKIQQATMQRLEEKNKQLEQQVINTSDIVYMIT
ncbi:hypothetical protein RJT34_09186 [Clitoria ternatea]|uniref:Helitron helicase-like domain-containing protein n=1 Tax=Clitoria ternatea TaxID=43366 RepID=A0AAN9K5I1_CLITE